MNLPDWFPRKMLYRPGEVAELLSLSSRTIRRDMARGAFGEGGICVRGGKRWITHDGFMHYLETEFSPE